MTDDEINAKFFKLLDAQLRFQKQLGGMAGLMRQAMQRQDLHEQELRDFKGQHERDTAEFRQRNHESDQRFNVLLEEIR